MIKSIEIERVLVPIDYTKPSFHAAWIAFSIAQSMCASLTLIHIHIQEKALRELVTIDQSEFDEMSQKKFEDILLRIVGDPSVKALQSAADHSVVEIESCSYSPSDEICNYATEKKIDLIVMGARVHSTIKDLLLGGVSTDVLHKAPCPVTIVH